MKDTKGPGPSDKQRIAFAKQVEYLYEKEHPGWRRMMWFSFVKGLATGLGVFLGGTIIVGLLLWILNGLGHVPFFDGLTDAAKDTLEQGN